MYPSHHRMSTGCAIMGFSISNIVMILSSGMNILPNGLLRNTNSNSVLHFSINALFWHAVQLVVLVRCCYGPVASLQSTVLVWFVVCAQHWQLIQ